MHEAVLYTVDGVDTSHLDSALNHIDPTALYLMILLHLYDTSL